MTKHGRPWGDTSEPKPEKPLDEWPYAKMREPGKVFKSLVWFGGTMGLIVVLLVIASLIAITVDLLKG